MIEWLPTASVKAPDVKLAVPELSRAAQVVLGESFSPVETYIMVALLYWALTAGVAALMAHVETRAAARAAPPALARVGMSGKPQ